MAHTPAAFDQEALDHELGLLRTRLTGLSPTEHGFAYLDERILAGVMLRPGRLSGWIIPAKDLSDVAGMPTTMGNVARTHTPEVTDEFLLALQRAGAIIPGKTLAPEMGLSAYTEPVGLPHPDNPTLPGHTPGGSSGGAAVMVARGLVRAAHASDGGGSIRVPAACTGIVGFKPAHNNERANPVAEGFLAGTLADSAYVNGIAPTALTPERRRHLRVGVLREPVHADVEVATHFQDAVEDAATALGRLGYPVTEVLPPYGREVFASFHTVLAARAAHIPGEASPLVSWLQDCGNRTSEEQLAQATDTFMGVRSRLLAAWPGVDVLLSPILAFDPPPHGFFSSLAPEEDFYAQTQWTPWATMFNMAGLPALTFPYQQVRTPLHLGGVRTGGPELFAVAADLHGDPRVRVGG